MLAAARRLIRAVKILAGDGRIPKPLRLLAGLGLLPVPGPLDEFVLLIVGVLLWTFYREPLREAWRRAADADLSGRQEEPHTGVTAALATLDQDARAMRRH